MNIFEDALVLGAGYDIYVITDLPPRIRLGELGKLWQMSAGDKYDSFPTVFKLDVSECGTRVLLSQSITSGAIDSSVSRHYSSRLMNRADGLNSNKNYEYKWSNFVEDMYSKLVESDDDFDEE